MGAEPLALVADARIESAKLVALTLRRAGFRIVTASDGPGTLARVAETSPDLVLVDEDLPNLSGHDVLRELRATHPVPIILLGHRGAPADVAAGLNLGADDYVTYPFDPTELAARARAVLRRSRPGAAAGKKRIGRLTVDLDRREVLRDGRPVPLARTEWLLLAEFVGNEGRILRHSELLTAVWGPAYRDDVAHLRHWIGQLRRTLGVGAWEEGPIRTIPGLGSAFAPTGRLPRRRSRRADTPAAVPV